MPSIIRLQRVRTLLVSLAGVLLAVSAQAQTALPTAVQPAQLSAFGGLTGDYTGLYGGKNLGLTAGIDLELPPVNHWIRPGIELRGTFPIDSGHVDSQRSILGGARVDIWLAHRLRPYGDFLFGRGEMKYGNGYFFQNKDYLLTTTWVEALGGGFDYDLSHHFAVKVDGQYQRWGAAPVQGGTIYAKAGTLGVVYIFNFNRHGIH